MTSSNKRQVPLELILLVASDVAPSVQAALCCTSRSVNAAITPLLYRNLVITRANVDKLFLGLPRSAEAKTIRVTKAQFDQEIEDFKERYVDLWAEDGDFDGYGSPGCDYDGSDPETDDECCPPLVTVKRDTRHVSWERRRELFAHTRRIAFAQVPSQALLKDLTAQLGVREAEGRGEREDDYDTPSPLFTSVTHVSFSSRVVQSVADGAAASLDGADPCHALSRLLCSRRLCRPTHVCITLPHGRDMLEFFRRSIRLRPENITAQTLEDVGFSLAIAWESVRHDPTPALLYYLPDTIKSLTVHDLRRLQRPSQEYHPKPGRDRHIGYGVPLLRQYSGASVKVFYNPGPGDSTRKLAPAIAYAAKETVSTDPVQSFTWEFVGDISPTQILEIHARAVAEAAAAQVEAVDDDEFQYLPEDDDPKAEAATEEALAEFIRAGKVLERAAEAAGAEYDEKLGTVPGLPARVAQLEAAALDADRKWANETRAQYVERRTENAQAAEQQAESNLHAAQDEAGERRMQKARERMAKAPVFDPHERIKFSSFEDAEPCAVCGGGNVVDTDLKELLDRAWSNPV